MASAENTSAESQARRLENASEQLTQLMRQPDVAKRLRTAPGKEDWSAMQVLGHVDEMIPYWLDQIHHLIAAPEPPTFGRAVDAPERLAGPARGANGDPDELLRQLHSEVETAAREIRQMSPSDRAKKGTHIRRGEVTVADCVETFIVAHAEEHLAQVRTALQA